jgi:hypothetical protein
MRYNRVIPVRVEEKDYRRLKQIAERELRTMSQVVRLAIREYLRALPPETMGTCPVCGEPYVGVFTDRPGGRVKAYVHAEDDAWGAVHFSFRTICKAPDAEED